MAPQKKIFFAIPCKSGQLEWVTVSSLLQSVAACRDHGWSIHFEAALYESLIPNARNLLAARFLQSQCTEMFWIDDDGGWTKAGFIALMSHREDFVCLPYRQKSDEKITYGLKLLDTKPNENGLLQVSHCGLGIAKMSRSVIEKMTEAFPRYYYPDGLPDLRCAALFEVPYENGQLNGEDVTFCNRWQSIGGEIWIDPRHVTDHVGKKNYSGLYANDA